MSIDWYDILEIILVNILVFSILLVLARALGKKQLSQLTFFNYITGITLGSIAANAINIRSTNYDDVISLVCWTVFTILISLISLKSPLLRVVFDGEPTILIKRGKIQKKALSKLMINVDDLMMLLRNKDVFNIKDAYYAILEPDGKLAVLKNEADKQVTKKDMNLDVNNKPYLPTEIIVDGNLIEKNLKELDITEKWVKEQLRKQGIKNYKGILYAELQDDGSLYIDKGE